MTADDFKNIVENRIVDWFEVRIKAAPTDEASLLLKRMSALIQRGGKRVRPQLLFMTYIAYGGKYPERLTGLGLALELHHQFLLIHDDIIDNDTIRYDGPNIVGYYLQDKFSKKHNIPQAMGLLAGDLLFSFSNQAIAKDKNLNNKQKVALLNMLNEANMGVGYGQQLDAYNVDISLSSFTEDKLVMIHSLKSAIYSSQLPMQCAATLLELSKNELDSINSFAKPFGILFQLVDDYSDYFINGSVFNNRPKYRDFRQGKITYPLYVALSRASKSEIEFIKDNLGNKELSKNVINKVIGIFKSCGAQETSRDFLQQYFKQSYIVLDKLKISADSKLEFAEMIEKYKV
jgi:geranylgeranyl diphosphate synthase, type I